MNPNDHNQPANNRKPQLVSIQKRLTSLQLENLTGLDIKTLTLELIIILLSSLRFVEFSNRSQICREALKNLKALHHELRKDQLKEQTEGVKSNLWSSLGRRLLPPFIQEALVKLLQEEPFKS